MSIDTVIKKWLKENRSIRTEGEGDIMTDHQKQVPGDDIMGTMPMKKLLLTSAMPMMLSLLFNSLYNTVDGIFVSRLGEKALTAISLAAPMQLLVSAIGNGLAIGLNATLSKALGEKNAKKAEDSVSSALRLALLTYLGIAAATLFVSGPFWDLQAKGDQAIRRYGSIYMTICLLFSFGNTFQYVFDRCLIAAGKGGLFLISLGTASGINLVLDPILIFGPGPIPALGIAGAAIATVIGQITGAFVSFMIGRKWNRQVKICLPGRLDKETIVTILKTGIPTAVMNGGVSIAGILINMLLNHISSTYVAIYGIILRVQNLSLIGVYGICLAMIPILAYNSGAGRPDRVNECFRISLRSSLIFYGMITALICLFAVPLLRLFSASGAMLAAGIPAIRLVAISVLISVYAILLSHYEQAMGRAYISMTLTILRQAILLPLFLMIFLHFGGKNAGSLIWISWIIAEGAGMLIAFSLQWTGSKKSHPDRAESGDFTVSGHPSVVELDIARE